LSDLFFSSFPRESGERVILSAAGAKDLLFGRFRSRSFASRALLVTAGPSLRPRSARFAQDDMLVAFALQ